MTSTTFDPEHYERLGAFYLGGEVASADGELTGRPVLYDSADLTTHAVIVGMTGSGKTGLGVCLLEEAAIDSVPALVIDPKGDMSNLLLTFPDLAAGDFEPWVDPGEAARSGRSVADQATRVADLWRTGLASWGQSGERIRRLREAAEFAIYTPGSRAGRPLSLLRTFSAPAAEVLADPEALGERLRSSVQGLLALVGIESDPLTGREHLLLANLLDHAWRSGVEVDLPALVRSIQRPPFDQLGVLDLETFYPAKDRQALALRINGLLAAPGFEVWLEGEPIDIGRLLFTSEGRPRVAVVSIAHLSESERMFVVTLLLGELVSWMRAQGGTSSLRALLYMDEIFGYFPPVRNPPSKEPMMVLLKQARAHGLGVVLSTQNPVDLDYKGLSNCGTWFLGRLQTERDKARVLDGLESASTTMQEWDRERIDQTLSSLGKRTFLLHNVHDEPGPVLFQTRWALSYLRGPLGRDEIARLDGGTEAVEPASPPPPPPPRPRPTQTSPVVPDEEASATAPSAQPSTERPVLPDDIEEVFEVPSASSSLGDGSRYQPNLWATAQLHFKRRGTEVDEWREVAVLAPIPEHAKRLDWEDANVHPESAVRWQREPPVAAEFAKLAPVARREASYRAAKKRLVAHLYQSQRVEAYRCDPVDLRSDAGEQLSEFRQRVTVALAEQRDLELGKLRKKYAEEIERLDGKIRTAEARVDRERSQLRDRKLQTAVSFGTSVLGALLGRKKVSVTNVGRATRAVRDVGRSRKEADDVERAEEGLEALLEQRQELEREMEKELESLRAATSSPSEVDIEVIEVGPLKTELVVDRLGLLWSLGS